MLTPDESAELLHELLDHRPFPSIYVWAFAVTGSYFVTDKDLPPVDGRGQVTNRAAELLAKREQK